MNIADVRKTINKTKQQYEYQRQKVREEREHQNILDQQIQDTEQAQQVIQEVAAGIQERAHQQIAQVVSRCLETIFEEPYNFKIVFEQKRGKTEAVLVFERNGIEVDPMSASGGGVVDVAAFALRLAALVLGQPRKRRLLVLDEPFRFLSSGNASRVRELLLGLSTDLGVQIIQVTHSSALIAGKVIELC